VFIHSDLTALNVYTFEILLQMLIFSLALIWIGEWIKQYLESCLFIDIYK